MAQIGDQYPVNLEIDYPEAPDRVTTLFRVFTVIPIAIILSLLNGPGYRTEDGTGWNAAFGGAGVLFAAVVLMLLFRQKYPRWWFDWNYNLTRFATRVGAYFALLMHVYPATDEDQTVHLDIPYPNAPVDLNRWLPLIKWFLAIPHYIVLFFLNIAAFIVTIIVWFAILITGRYPEDFFGFVVGVFRWNLRVFAYAFLLTTDRYPPFRLSP
ncbi:MAG: DUF4389 domain-containing protein [Dehalococcoidales bacterium]|nr:DUF4389 domain-containing protein [Dehalococcoidales bacterium]